MAGRPVTLLAAGGTIAMSGDGAGPATPALDAAALLDAVPGLRERGGVEARTIAIRPSSHLTGPEALALAREIADAAEAGSGVVVAHGTDTLEEVAFLCDLIYAGDAPLVFTGAMRVASAAGADGPANLLDAVAAAAGSEAAGLGVLVCFAGELHAARAVRKAASTGPAAFASPGLGPLGRVAEDRVSLLVRVERRPPLAVSRLDAVVHTVVAGLGTDGAVVDAAAGAGADGLVAVLLGAGHSPPAFLDALGRAASRMPVVATVRPEIGAILRSTYGFEGAEADLRASGAICAAALSPAAARIKLMACLGAGADPAGAFAPDDR